MGACLCNAASPQQVRDVLGISAAAEPESEGERSVTEAVKAAVAAEREAKP